MKSRVRFPTFRIDVGARRYLVDCKVIPPRAPAHAAAGTPRFLDPGSPGSVEIKRVRERGFVVTPDPDLRLLLRDRCSRAAGVGRSSVAQRGEQALLEFQR
jgi:hypothetical protein